MVSPQDVNQNAVPLNSKVIDEFESEDGFTTLDEKIITDQVIQNNGKNFGEAEAPFEGGVKGVEAHINAGSEIGVWSSMKSSILYLPKTAKPLFKYFQIPDGHTLYQEAEKTVLEDKELVNPAEKR